MYDDMKRESEFFLRQGEMKPIFAQNHLHSSNKSVLLRFTN